VSHASRSLANGIEVADMEVTNFANALIGAGWLAVGTCLVGCVPIPY